MSNIQDLKSRAAEIRDASEDAENTALRVGSLLVDMTDEIAGASAAASAVSEAIAGKNFVETAEMTAAHKTLKAEITAKRPETVVLSESEYEAKKAAGELSDDVIYMTYEDDSE